MKLWGGKIRCIRLVGLDRLYCVVCHEVICLQEKRDMNVVSRECEMIIERRGSNAMNVSCIAQSPSTWPSTTLDLADQHIAS